MLYTDILDNYSNEAEKAILSLFRKVKKNQSDKNDLLLVFINGFYNQNTTDGWSPYEFGPNTEGFTNQTQYEFFDVFRKRFLIESGREDLKKSFSTDAEWKNYHIVTQLEMLVYLKFWESDLILKQLYNMCCRLLHGEHYDWHKDMKNAGRKSLIENQIINRSKNKVPTFHSLISSIYNRQVRNAVAHSQFYILGDFISLTNYNPDESHSLRGLSIDEWEVMFHRTVLFYNYLIGMTQDHFQQYKDEAKDRHFGKKVRITYLDGKQKYRWVRYLYKPDRWVWYRT